MMYKITDRASLPSSSGGKEEDPMRFISNYKCIIQQANIHKVNWVRAIEPQLTAHDIDLYKIMTA